MNAFGKNILQFTGHQELLSGPLATIQANVGLQCNLECRHCHLSASPKRKERMEWPVMEEVVRLAERSDCRFVDITGGAPELNPLLPQFLGLLVAKEIRVQVRTNLSIYLEPGMADMARTLRDFGVGLVGSLPCYLEQNVDNQRGEGVYRRAIAAMRLLNDLGYGRDPRHPLNLVYNPLGAFLPPEACTLENDYRRELFQRHQVEFTRLLTITNMPIGRFRSDLKRQGDEAAYLRLLFQAFNPNTLEGLMCRNQISIGWDGALFDCDFNLALNRPARIPETPRVHGMNPNLLENRPIVTGDHCFACTAGRGSSCAGALVA